MKSFHFKALLSALSLFIALTSKSQSPDCIVFTDEATNQVLNLKYDWTTNLSEIETTGYQEARSLAYHNGYIYIPVCEPVASDEYKVRIFDTKTGKIANESSIKLTAQQLNLISSKTSVSNSSDLKHFYLLNDEAGNMIAVFDPYYNGLNIASYTYPVIFGIVNDDLTIDTLNIVEVKNNSKSQDKWGQLGHGAIKGNVAENDFELLQPYSIIEPSATTCYFTRITPAEVVSKSSRRTSIYFTNYPENDYSSNPISNSGRDYFSLINSSFIIMDMNGHLPYFANVSTTVYATSQMSNETLPDTDASFKGVSSFNFEGSTFLICGKNISGNKSNFLLASLPECPTEIDENSNNLPYLNGANELVTFNTIPSVTFTPVAVESDSDISNESDWNLSKVIDSADKSSKEIYLYSPAGYLAKYSLSKYSGTVTFVNEISMGDIVTDASYWTISGQRLAARPTHPGIYIIKTDLEAHRIIIR